MVRNIFFSTRRAFPSINKDVLPTHQQSLVIYQYKCQCEADYVDKTIQRVEVRIAQHISGQIHRRVPVTSKRSQAHDSVTCRSGYTENFFSILHKAQTRLHFNILEAALINIQYLTLCKQRELKHKLILFGESIANSRPNWEFFPHPLPTLCYFKILLLKKKSFLYSNLVLY